MVELLPILQEWAAIDLNPNFLRRRARDSEHEGPRVLCEPCARYAILKSRTEDVSRMIEKAVRRRPAGDTSQEEPVPNEAAAAWIETIASNLRHGMDAHSRCKICTILLGPGHIEADVQGYCGTCYATRRGIGQTNGDSSYPSGRLGRRGWFNRDRPYSG